MALNRKGMEQTIADGGSVLYKNRIITKVENLPSAADLAQTPEELEAAEAELDEQRQKVEAQKAAIAEKKGKAKK